MDEHGSLDISTFLSVIPMATVVMNKLVKCQNNCTLHREVTVLIENVSIMNLIICLPCWLLFFKQFIYGYTLSVVQYLLCNKCLAIKFQKREVINQNWLIKRKIKIFDHFQNEMSPGQITFTIFIAERHTYKTFEYLTVDDSYMTVIISGLKILRDESYFSFKSIFDNQVKIIQLGF